MFQAKHSPLCFRRIVEMLALTLVLQSTQSTTTFAQPASNQPIYSDDWALTREFDRSELPSGSAPFMILMGGVCGVGAMGFSQALKPKNPLHKLMPELLFIGGAWAAGAAAAYGCGTAALNFSKDTQRKSEAAAMKEDSLVKRVEKKLQYDLLRHFRNGQDAESPNFQPLRQAIFERGITQVSSEFSLLQDAIRNGESLATLQINYGHLLLDSSDQELLRYLYRLRRAEKAGLPLSSVSNRSEKTTNPGTIATPRTLSTLSSSGR